MMVERIDKSISIWSKVGMAFIIGWMASSISHQTAVTDKAATTLQSVQTQIIPALKAKAGCESWRGDVLEKQAKSIVIIPADKIPQDCPPLKLK